MTRVESSSSYLRYREMQILSNIARKQLSGNSSFRFFSSTANTVSTHDHASHLSNLGLPSLSRSVVPASRSCFRAEQPAIMATATLSRLDRRVKRNDNARLQLWPTWRERERERESGFNPGSAEFTSADCKHADSPPLLPPSPSPPRPIGMRA